MAIREGGAAGDLCPLLVASPILLCDDVDGGATSPLVRACSPLPWSAEGVEERSSL